MGKQKIVAILTLGCSKNTVDTEVLAGMIRESGMEVLFDSFSRADVAIVNTCGFIGDAREESIDTIIRLLEWKRNGNVEKVLVMGCLVQIYKEQLKKELPDVDGFYGVTAYREIMQALSSASTKPDPRQRFLSTPSHYAYLKISEGCDRRCAFCAIPVIRGKNVSRTMKSLLEEASVLAGKGVKELNVVAQDTTAYGVDLYGQKKLGELLGKLAGLNLFEWIRLHYTFPAGFPADLLSVIREHPSICNYIDIPLQHISDPILKSMRRGITAGATRKLLDRIRHEIPGVAVRTAFIVGYPGETRAQFNELLRFVKEQRFDRAGVFTYSAEEGTAAGRLKDSVSMKTKNARAADLMSIQQEISAEINESKVGSRMKVLIDREEGGYLIGRTEFDSPEVDNEVLIHHRENLSIGSFYEVKITAAGEFDLFAEKA